MDLESLPRLTRHTYRVEMLHMALWGGVAAVLEGGIAAVIVAKTFHGSAWQISVVRATPVVTNMLSVIWGMMAVRRAKIPLLTVACGGAAASLVGTAFVPSGYAWSGWLFTAQLVLARIFLSGTATLRTAIWKANYPQSVRGQLAGRLQKQGMISRLISLYIVSWVMDLNPLHDNLLVPRIVLEKIGLGPWAYYLHAPHWLVSWGGPDAYRWLYPMLSIVGAAAVLLLQFIRVRGDKQLPRRLEQEEDSISPQDRGLEEYSLTSILSPAIKPWQQMVQVLRRDRAFRVYQIAQMFTGGANLLVDPIMVIIFVNVLKMNYTWSTAMLDMVPAILAISTVTYWAKLYDRWGLPKFRVVNGGIWTLRMIMTAAAVVGTQYMLNLPHGYTIVVVVFVFAEILNGIAQGGGGIAWNLGHLHFAKPEEAELYMGIHATLTGIRGWLGFVGAPLYLWGGWPVFAVAAVISCIGFILFFHGMTTRFGLGGAEPAARGVAVRA